MPRREAEDDPSLNCTICLSTPTGTVNQCTNGHLFCGACLEEHRQSGRVNSCKCPVCRVKLTDPPIRCLVAEQQIARQPTVCQHCNKNMTRGELGLHLGACAKRRVSCCAAGDGCDWTGLLLSEKPRHDMTRPSGQRTRGRDRLAFVPESPREGEPPLGE